MTDQPAPSLHAAIVAAVRDCPAGYPDDLADALWRAVQPTLARHYQHAVDAAVAAERRTERAEADRKTLGQSALGYQQRAWDAEAAIRRVRALADRLDEFAENALKTSDRQLYATLARDIRQRIDALPAHNTGPTVAEAAADDRRWWGGEKTGEQP